MPTTTMRTSRRPQPATAAPLTLAALQDAFQSAIRDGDETVLAHITDGPHTTRDVLIGVYRHAYGARLVEIMAGDQPTLLSYLGDQAFEDMARHYIAERPSQSRNARDVSRGLPEFLAATAPYRNYPFVAEIAEIERALNDAFDEADAALLTLADLAQLPPDRWSDLILTPHPTTRFITCRTNAFDIWAGLRRDEAPPQPAMLVTPQPLIVWRDETTPRIRPLKAEEAMLWVEAVGATQFGRLCELAATHDDPDGAPLRVAQTLQVWLTGGLIAGYRP